MDRKILVAYASKHGATQEIAEKIGEVLLKAGLRVEILPAKSVKDLSAYRAVILGSALYINKWQKEAEALLKANVERLAQLPVWLFSSGPTAEGDPVQLVEGKRLPAGLQSAANRIHPRDIAVFHGYNNLEKLNFIEKWAIKSVVKKQFGDFRDWNMITSWAGTIAAVLKEIDYTL